MNHLYESSDGIVHSCKGEYTSLGNMNYLVYTKCEIDVPANKSFNSDERVTCPKCLCTKELMSDSGGGIIA